MRRAFGRAASDYAAAAAVPREIGRRLLEHLEPIRLQVNRVADIGAATGESARALARRYRDAEVVLIDSALPMVARSRPRWPRPFSRLRYLCGDAGALPLADRTVQLLYSNLALQCSPSPDRALAEFGRVLAPGGAVVFSTLGPDSLWELREAWSAVDDGTHVHPFPDMHDVGDALQRSGFAGVVMETERITVEYPHLDALVRELRRLGSVNALPDRARGLGGRNRLAALSAAYDGHRYEGRLPVTLDVVYGHGFRPDSQALEVQLEPLHVGRKHGN
jgi:malonyl-CoA O-methyltransferase